MVDYNFEQIIGQRVSFVPDVDSLRFTALSATGVSIAQTGVTLTLSTAQGTVQLDATPTLADTPPGVLTPTNIRFANGSFLVVGDLTTATAPDNAANSIDFSSNLTLISGLNADNQIVGLGGNDTVISGDGENLVFGGAGADSVTVGQGANTLYGGSGSADSSDGADSFVLGSGNNVVYGNAGGDSVTFSAVTAAGNLLTFFGGLGADTLSAADAAGRFFINGGPDADRIVLTGGTTSHTLYGGLGSDSIDLTGSTGAHTVYGGTGLADTADGGDGITLGGGSSVLYANAGADTVSAAADAGRLVTLYLGLGGDQFSARAGSGQYLIFGGNDGDAVNLTNHTGQATVYGGSGIADSADGGDTITAAGTSVIYGNGGGDVITVSPGSGRSATVYGGAGNDTLNAAPAAAGATLLLYGNSGSDVFALNFASAAVTVDLADFGDGTDSLDLTLSGGAAAADLSVTRSSTQTVLQNAFSERIVLGQFTGEFSADNLSLADGSFLLSNNGTATTLTGGAGDDQLIAGALGDTLIAGAGNDLLTGGAGNDRFTFLTADLTQDDTVVAGDGADTLNLTTPGTAIDDGFFRNKSGIDTLRIDTGDYSAATIFLGSQGIASGITNIDATAATAVTLDLSAATRGLLVRGGTGGDSVTGSVYQDAIDGKAGDDTINGGRENDVLAGGEGEDLFVFALGFFEGRDTLRDVNFGEDSTSVDRLQFTAAEAGYNLGNRDAVVDGAILTSITSAGATGTELIVLKGVGIATSGMTAALDIINANVAPDRDALNLFFDTTLGRGVLYYDTNGNASGGHRQLITFDNITGLSGLDGIDFNDFVFV